MDFTPKITHIPTTSVLQKKPLRKLKGKPLKKIFTIHTASREFASGTHTKTSSNSIIGTQTYNLKMNKMFKLKLHKRYLNGQ